MTRSIHAAVIKKPHRYCWHLEPRRTIAKKTAIFHPYSQKDVDSAIRAAADNYNESSSIAVNIWFDNEKGSRLSELYVLSGHSELEHQYDSGNLIVLFCDLLITEEPFTGIYQDRQITLLRENSEADWQIISQGY